MTRLVEWYSALLEGEFDPSEIHDVRAGLMGIPEVAEYAEAEDLDEIIDEIMEYHESLQELSVWSDLSDKLKVLKAKESKARKAVIGAFFKTLLEGTNTKELPAAWKLKAKKSVTRSLDKAGCDSLLKKLRADEGSKEDLAAIEGVIDWKPSLKLADYKKLTKEQKDLLKDVLTVKDGSVGLELVIPKEK